ncbi:MAG: ABC transporter permease [Armatimonadetes bacterium]|nr:ABC transporter permease [Armatimonadota bacterium]
MKFHAWGALAGGVIKESIRRKDLWVIAILSLVILLFSSALGFFGVQGLQVFAKDLGLTLLSVLSTIMAALISTRLLPDELKSKTIYPLAARPISRFDLLFGKYLGAVFATWVGFLLLATTTFIGLAIFKVSFEPILLQYLVFKAFGLALLCSVGMMFSLYCTTNAAATLTMVLAFGGTILSRGLTMAYGQSAPALQAFFKALNAVLPQYGLFDLGGRAANVRWSPAPMWVAAFLFGYAVVYSGFMLALGMRKFGKQAL